MSKYLIVILSILIFSCIKTNDNKIKKLVLIGIGTMCTYDSAGIPQLSLRKYFEYSPNNNLKLANGNYKYYQSKNAPQYSLDKFFELENNDSVKLMIDRTLFNKQFNEKYTNNGDGIFYALIYETEKSKATILYHVDKLPNDLKGLHLFIMRQWNELNCDSISKYSVDKMVVDFEKDLFQKHPPPPPPSEIDTKFEHK